jgi:hypothetical protein
MIGVTGIVTNVELIVMHKASPQISQKKVTGRWGVHFSRG